MLKTTKYLLAISILGMSMVNNATSKEISYDYIQGTYILLSDDSLDTDGDAFALSWSFSATPNIAVTALTAATNYDSVSGMNIDANEFSFGITAHTSIAPGTDVYGTFSIVFGDLEVGAVSDDDTGNAISVGLRHMVSDTVEIEAAYSRVAIFDDTGNAVGFGARYHAYEKLSFGVGYSTSDDVDALLLDARLDFK